MSDSLETRYRRLMRSYPRWYRNEREDEIIGVLMDNAREGQRRPTPLEAVDVVHAGLSTRWRATGRSYATSPWRDVIAIVTVALPVVLAARALRPLGLLFNLAVVQHNAWNWQRSAGDLFQGWQGPAVWALVAAALLCTRLRLAAVLGVVAVGVDAALVIGLARRSATYLAQRQVAILVLEIFAAALLWRRREVERGIELLGQWTLFRLALGSAALYGYANPMVYAGSLRSTMVPLSFLVALALLGPLAWSHRALLRQRRLWLRLLVPALAVASLVAIGTEYSRQQHGPNPTANLLIEVGLCASAATSVMLVGWAVSAASQRIAAIRQADCEAHT